MEPTAGGAPPPSRSEAATRAPSAERLRRCVLCAALAVAVAFAYRELPSHGFLSLDDDIYVVANRHVLAGLSGEGVRWALAHTGGGNWHPVTWLSHLADATLFGGDAGGHHAVSGALHALNGLLLFLFLARATGRTGRSALAAALFALHPLRVEAVAWVAERKELLCSLFVLLALRAYGAYAARGGARRYALVTLLFALALASKPMAVTFPLLLLLVDSWPLRRAPIEAGAWAAWRPLLAEKAPWLLLSAGYGLFFLRIAADTGTLAPLADLPVGARLANAVVAVAAYAGKTLVPTGLATPYPLSGGYPPAWEAAASALLVLAATAACLAARRRLPWLAASWLWFLAALLPVSGLLQAGEQSHADRYTYLPGMGLSVLLAWGAAEGAARLPGRLRAAAPAAALLALAALAVASGRQARHWKDSETLYRRALEVTERNWFAESGLAGELFRRGDAAGAARHFEAALAINPGYEVARFNYGLLLARAGATEAAVAQLEEATRLRPDYFKAHYNLSLLYRRLGRAEEADRHLALALPRRPAP